VTKDMGDNVVVDPKGDDKQGNDNKMYQRLLHRLPYSLTKDVIDKLSKDYPSLFFVSSDHFNHSHPISHGRASVSWREMTRRLPMGARALDVCGNPAEAEKFNAVQQRSKNPKNIRTLVCPQVPADFKREMEKWGPRLAPVPPGPVVVGEGRYDYGRLQDMSDEYLQQFDHFIFHHTAYYFTPGDILRIVQAVPNAMIHINMVRHKADSGLINHGEIAYKVKGKGRYGPGGWGVVEQRNVLDGAKYYHPNVSAFWLGEEREWYPAPDSPIGLTWEAWPSCEDNWMIEVVLVDKRRIPVGTIDWAEVFQQAELDDCIETRNSPKMPQSKLMTTVPTPDGEFLQLQIVNEKLVEELRRIAMGKKRAGSAGRELLEMMFQQARLFVQPGSLFPGREPMYCPPEYLADHVLCAWVTDVPRERDIYEAATALRPLLEKHAKSMFVPLAIDVKGLSMNQLLSGTRQVVKGILVSASVILSNASASKGLDRLSKMI